MIPTPSHAARRRRRLLTLGPVLLLTALGASGCGVESLPTFGFPDPATPQGESTMRLWQGSATASLVVGVFVWGLIFWAIVAYRKRGDTIPRQVQYNLPVEILYTLVPVVIVAVLFVFTYRNQVVVLKETKNPDVTIGVVGFRWGWEFDHVDSDVQVISQRGPEGTSIGEPVLVLPTNRTIRFTESSPDVIHSFYVPAFLFKRDVIPGRINTFELSIDTPGTYVGRCAELCGEYHSQMDFTVKAVSPSDYAAYLAANKGTINGVPATRAAVSTAAGTDGSAS